MTPESSSLAEAARRLLRTDGCTLEVPSRMRSEAERLALAIYRPQAFVYGDLGRVA